MGIQVALNDNHFYIYGAGLFGLAFCDYMVQQGRKPVAIIDLIPPKKSHAGIDIIPFDRDEFDYSLPIAVTILGYDGVTESLITKGFKNIIETKALFDDYPQAMSIMNQCGFLWMQKPKESQYNEINITRLKCLLSDDKSRDTLKNLIAYRQSPSADNYPWPESYEMYFPEDIPNLYALAEFNILDVGAYDGDTLDGFYRRWPDKIQSYTAIEVSPENILQLEKRLKILSIPQDKYRIIAGAVGVNEGKTLVLRGENSATYVTEINKNNFQDDDTLVESYTLNDIAEDHLCNIIKMDIEGADFTALEQARVLIRTKTPTLALSIYHAPNDLWRIPLLIDDISPKAYKFYLRQEGHWGLETIFYAIPKSNY